jgi:hypothetical protein
MLMLIGDHCADRRQQSRVHRESTRHTPDILSFVPLHAFATTLLIPPLVISAAKRKP